MPSEVKNRSLTGSTNTMGDGQPKEFVWGCTLSKENPTVTWSFEEEDEDSDYLRHTLFLRHAVLGAEVVKEERNIVEIETKTSTGKMIRIPIASLTKGLNEMTSLDINFNHEVPVTFRLLHGNGPIHLSAQELVEFPMDELDETELEFTEDDAVAEDLAEDEDEEEEDGKPKKRKALTQKKLKTKRGKLDTSTVSDENDSEDEEEEDEESMDEEDDDEDDEDDDYEEKPRKKGVKAKARSGKAAIKKLKPATKNKKIVKKMKAK